jgi:hypothetical protein
MFMSRTRRTAAIGVVVAALGFGGHLVAQGRGNTPPVTGAATATGAIDGSITGAFDSGGNFSGSGTMMVDFSQDLPLVNGAGHGVPLNGTIVADMAFTTLAGTGGSLLAMEAGDDIVKSARFTWPNLAYQKGSTDPTNYSLHFRGNAVLDGVTEMSRLKVTCTADGANGCVAWVLTPCLLNDNSPCTVNDVSVQDDPNPPNGIGQLVGSFPKGVGNRDIARYVMNWSMTLSR